MMNNFLNCLMAIGIVFVIGAIKTYRFELMEATNLFASLYLIPLFMFVIIVGIILLPVMIIEYIVLRVMRIIRRNKLMKRIEKEVLNGD